MTTVAHVDAKPPRYHLCVCSFTVPSGMRYAVELAPKKKKKRLASTFTFTTTDLYTGITIITIYKIQ